PQAFGIDAELAQHPARHVLVRAREAQEDMLASDVVVTEPHRFSQRELERLLGTRGERDLTGRLSFAAADDLLDARTSILERDTCGRERARAKTVFLPQQPEQKVLGADVVVAEVPRFLLRKDDDLARAL